MSLLARSCLPSHFCDWSEDLQAKGERSGYMTLIPQPQESELEERMEAVGDQVRAGRGLPGGMDFLSWLFTEV